MEDNLAKDKNQKGKKISDERKIKRLINQLFSALTAGNRALYRQIAGQLKNLGKKVMRYRDAEPAYKEAGNNTTPDALGLVS